MYIISLYKLQVMNFIASSYYLLQAKRQRKAQRDANSQNNLTSSNSSSADDVKMDGSQSVASIHSTAGTTADEDSKSVMRIGHRTIGDAREHEQMLIKVVQGQSVSHPSIHPLINRSIDAFKGVIYCHHIIMYHHLLQTIYHLIYHHLMHQTLYQTYYTKLHYTILQ